MIISFLIAHELNVVVLDVWKLSMQLCSEIYKICEDLPSEEKYGLTSQMKRAAISVPSNLSEGAARNSDKEFLQFLSIAQGSLSELDTQLELCCNYLNLIDHDKASHIFKNLEKISKMISGLKKSLKKEYEKITSHYLLLTAY